MKYDAKFLKHWKAAGMTDTKETLPMKKVLYGYWAAGYRDGVQDMKAINVAIRREQVSGGGGG